MADPTEPATDETKTDPEAGEEKAESEKGTPAKEETPPGTPTKVDSQGGTATPPKVDSQGGATPKESQGGTPAKVDSEGETPPKVDSQGGNPPKVDNPGGNPTKVDSQGGATEAPDGKSKKPPPPPKEPKESAVCVTPIPSGEDLSQDESNKVIALTQDILQHIQKKVDTEKIDSHSLAFMLIRVRESLDSYYNDYIPMLNTFLYYADQITADYFAQMCCALPSYGDFLKDIEKEEEDTVDVDLSSPVPKQNLIDLVQNVTDTYYTAAMFVKSSRTPYRDINSIQNERRDMVMKVVKNIPDWLKLQEDVTRCLENIREQTFKISAYVDFLKQGETKFGPTLDLSKLSQGEEEQDIASRT